MLRIVSFPLTNVNAAPTVEYGMFTNTFVVSGSDVYIDNPM
jgi:hypothetical protein